jgi:hypothetical protein
MPKTEKIILIDDKAHKFCIKCNTIKEISLFSQNNKSNKCKKCICENMKAKYHADKPKYYHYVRKTVKLTDLEKVVEQQ